MITIDVSSACVLSLVSLHIIITQYCYVLISLIIFSFSMYCIIGILYYHLGYIPTTY